MIITRSENTFVCLLLIKYPTVNKVKIKVYNVFLLSWNILVKFSNFPNSFQYPLWRGGMFQRIVKLTLQEPKIVPRNILLREFNRNKRSRTQQRDQTILLNTQCSVRKYYDIKLHVGSKTKIWTEDIMYY